MQESSQAMPKLRQSPPPLVRGSVPTLTSHSGSLPPGRAGLLGPTRLTSRRLPARVARFSGAELPATTRSQRPSWPPPWAQPGPEGHPRALLGVSLSIRGGAARALLDRLRWRGATRSHRTKSVTVQMPCGATRDRQPDSLCDPLHGHQGQGGMQPACALSTPTVS